MKLEELYQNLGYKFKNAKLLTHAMRHRSMGKESNERLEFLGDSVLNFVIAAELYNKYPDEKEGELSRLRANLVNGEILAELANDLKIGDYMLFGHGELKSSTPRKSLLADAMEAIIGAIYLDAGLEIAQQVILNWFKLRLEQADIIGQKDPKTRLQEWLQMHKLPLPVYTVTSTEGAAHAQTFYVTCSVQGLTETAVGVGTSKRYAERDAAEKFLIKLGIKI
jgi:ribonuclease III